MKERLCHRIEALKKEFATGQRQLQDLEHQQVGLRETLLRISGAIQVLEEVLKESVSEIAKSEVGNGLHQPNAEHIAS